MKMCMQIAEINLNSPHGEQKHWKGHIFLADISLAHLHLRGKENK